MADIEFAIPSLGRADRVLTIQTMLDHGVKRDNIHVFVVEEEAGEYRKHTGVDVVVGELGIGNQRTFINGYFPAGSRYVSMDDDVTLIQKTENKVKPFEGSLVDLAARAFDLCDEVGAKLWGIPDTNNGFFMKHQTVHGLRVCTGGLMGEYAGLPECQSRRDHTEDLEKGVLHYLKYGGHLRLDDLSTKQKRYTPGGVIGHLGSKERRLEIYRQAVLDLAEAYPGLVHFKDKGDPSKGMARVSIKTVNRYPSLLQ